MRKIIVVLATLATAALLSGCIIIPPCYWFNAPPAQCD